MPGIDGRLVGTLLVAMLGLQAVCWLLAKGLRLRLARSAVICGWLAPLIVLAPALVSRQLLAPTDVLWGTPGAPPIARAPQPGARGIAATAAITAGLLLSGNPETAAFGGLFAAVCGLGLRRKRAGLRRGFGAAALAAVLGFGLAAPLLLPFAALLPDSQRAGDTLAQTVHPGQVRALSPPSWFEPDYAAYMLAPTSPRAYGIPYQTPFDGPFDWEDSEAGYTGLVAFATALIALLGVRDRLAWPFLGCAAAGPLLAARFLPLAHLLYAIPPLRIPIYSRFLPSASLALCLAGAFGIDLLLSRERLRIGAWVGLALAAALSLAVAADGWTLTLWGLLAAAALTMRR